jgi:hypothetical protein
LWWSQTRARRFFGDHIHPDAYAHWHTPTHHPGNPGDHEGSSGGRSVVLGLFVEYDTGTEPAHQLAAKLTGYHHLAAATAITTPVLIWLATPTRETTARRALASAVHALPRPELVPIATTSTNTTSTAETTGSAAGPVWAPLSTTWAHHRGGIARISLDDLARAWPATHHHGPTPDGASVAGITAGVAVDGPGQLTAPTPTPPPAPTAHPANHTSPPATSR